MKQADGWLLSAFSCRQAFILADSFYIRSRSFASFAPHALKGQKLLAQGIALGYFVRKPVAL